MSFINASSDNSTSQESSPLFSNLPSANDPKDILSTFSNSEIKRLKTNISNLESQFSKVSEAERIAIRYEIAAIRNEIAALIQTSHVAASAEVNIAASGLIVSTPKRKKRWDDINEKITKKNRDGYGSYSSFTWNDVKSVFDPLRKQYVIQQNNIPEETLTWLSDSLRKVSICFDNLDGKEAKRLFFINLIIVAVCNFFHGEVKVLVEEDHYGNYVKANGRFEMVLQRGAKRLCIVEAKKDDIEQGKAQCLVGCEVISDVDQVSTVYGIITTYEVWSFTKSTDDEIFENACTLAMNAMVPTIESLKEITGKICGMLSEVE